jgi:uncharacterized protein YdeI (YjbR/CyaY-like superfamily)
MSRDFSNLKRPRQPLSDDIRLTLTTSGLMDAYQARPAYQQNDYLGWIESAKKPETRQKRLQQMLDELEKGGIYMKMKHAASAKRK